MQVSIFRSISEDLTARLDGTFFREGKTSGCRDDRTDLHAALQQAAEKLGTSPTKAEYEDLKMTPAASTILRVIGSWNAAKERAGLETNPSRGSRLKPQPDSVVLPEGVAWGDLLQDQRWHYRNVGRNTQRTLQRRNRLRTWVTKLQSDRGCTACGETDPRCLDFHHPTDDKEQAITDMDPAGHSKGSLRDEIATCKVFMCQLPPETPRHSTGRRSPGGCPHNETETTPGVGIRIPAAVGLSPLCRIGSSMPPVSPSGQRTKDRRSQYVDFRFGT